MNERSSRLRWRGGVMPLLLTAGLGLLCRSARAAVPLDAQLTFTDAHDNPIGSGSMLTEYVGILFPDGETLSFPDNVGGYPGVRVHLYVRLFVSPTPVDVSNEPNTLFSSDHGSWFKNDLWFDNLKPGQNVKITAAYLYRQSGHLHALTVQASVALRLFPLSSVDDGPAHVRLISEISQFADQVAAWASKAGTVSEDSRVQIQADLETLRLLLLARYTFPIAHRIDNLVRELHGENAPNSLLIRLSQITLDLAQAGEVSLVRGRAPGAASVFGVGESIPAWVLPQPAMFPYPNPLLAATSRVFPVVSISWFDLGDDGDW